MPAGGARNGAGRKSDTTLAYQAARRSQVEEIVTPEQWDKAVRSMLRQIQKGNVKAFGALAPYVMGAAPKEISGTVDGDGRFVFVVE
jgi:hypothetical protein